MMKLVDRRTVLRGTAGLVAAGLTGVRPRSALAQSTQGVSENEILIGALGQLSGPFAFIGAPGRDNIQLAVEKINEAGGINGRKLTLIFEHASTPAEAVGAAKKLVENDKVFVLVIATGSTGAAAAADYVRAVKIPTYNTVGATPIIRNPFARNVFHGSIPEAGFSGQGMIDIAFRAVPKAKRIGILSGTYAFPQSHLAEIKPRLEKGGRLEALVVEQFDAAARDYTAQLISFARQRIEVLIILGSFTEAGFVIKQAPEKGLGDISFVLDGSGTNNAIIPIIGAENTKNVWGYYNAPFFPTQDEPPMSNYRKLLTDQYGQLPQGRPNIYDLIGYGSTYILAQVLQKAGRDLTSERLISAWETLKNAKPSDIGGYDVIFPETVTPDDHQGNKLVAPTRIVGDSWRVVS